MSVNFLDAKGDAWSIKLTIARADLVKQLSGVDLYDRSAWETLLSNPRVACSAAASSLQPEIVARGLTIEDFLDRLDGDAAAACVDAFLEALVNFTRAEFRETRQKMIAKVKEMTKAEADLERAKMDSPAMTDLVRAEMSRRERELDQKIAEATKSANQSGQQLEGSELTPAT